MVASSLQQHDNDRLCKKIANAKTGQKLGTIFISVYHARTILDPTDHSRTQKEQFVDSLSYNN